jgi:hypothetical protein
LSYIIEYVQTVQVACHTSIERDSALNAGFLKNKNTVGIFRKISALIPESGKAKKW